MPAFQLLVHRLCVEPRTRLLRHQTGDMSSSATLGVDGLVCTACAARVEARLRALPGVLDAVVDLNTSEATVQYDPERTGPDAFVRVADDAAVLRPIRKLIAAVVHRPAEDISA